MKTYLVEVYLPAGDADVFVRAALGARRAGESAADEGVEVRYVHSLFIPSDKTCFHLFEGLSAEAIVQVCRRSAFDHDRIVEVLRSGLDDAAPPARA